MNKVITFLLFFMAAQNKPEKPVSLDVPINTYKQARWEDKITKDGHYIGSFDDPNNEWRCDVVSYLDTNTREGITSLTIVCTKKREPEHEK